MRGLIAALVIVLGVAGAAATGVLFQPGDWYAALTKPAATPPDWVFPVAWTALYLAMALAAWLVWRRQGMGSELTLFAIQLALNAAWTPVVFGAHRLGTGLGIIIGLWVAVALVIPAFWRVKPFAGALMLPYLAWISFAGYLNAGLWYLN